VLTPSFPSNLERDFNSTVLKRMPYVTDLSCGNPGGAAPIANTRSGGTRIDACESGRALASAYLPQTEDTSGTSPSRT